MNYLIPGNSEFLVKLYKQFYDKMWWQAPKTVKQNEVTDRLERIGIMESVNGKAALTEYGFNLILIMRNERAWNKKQTFHPSFERALEGV